MTDKVRFLQTRFDRMTPEEAVETLRTRLLSRQGGRVFYANAHTLLSAFGNEDLRDALEKSDLLLADGSGVRWGSAITGTPLQYNLNGTDLVPKILKNGAEDGLTVYLLGGKPGVGEDAAATIRQSYPGVRVVGVQHGYFDENDTSLVLQKIRAANPHLLLVALGVPLQEVWINQFAAQLPGITCMGVGGLLDFLAHRVPRAPHLIRGLGMEWAWRMAMEPSRLWKRYLLGNLVFTGLVFYHAFVVRPTKLEPKLIQTELTYTNFPFEASPEIQTLQLEQVRSA